MARIFSTPGGGKTLGTASADDITGSWSGDHIFAGAGDDTINAGAGNDMINGGAGRDAINGGLGNDTVSYSNAPANQPGLPTGVYVNLTTGLGDGSDARGDTYVSIENVIGSGYADTITGNAVANDLKGLAGNDVIQGGAGADTMDGGADIDTLAYYNSTAGVTVNLATGAASGGDAQGDTFVNFESVMGSAYSDTLTGTTGDNALWGGDSFDFLFGLGGADKIWGGAGIDTIDGGAGNDTINGGADGDILTGGANADVFVFETHFAADDQGIDVITDFQDGVDKIRFDVDYDDTQGMAQLTFIEVLGNTIINYDNGSVTLMGVTAAQLTAADFEFV